MKDATVYSAFDTHRKKKYTAFKAIAKAERKKSLGRPRHKWEDNIKIDIKLNWMSWTLFASLKTGTSPGVFENDNEISGPLNGGNPLNS